MSTSNVYAFPLYRQRKIVMAVSAALSTKDGERATRYWRQTAKSLLQQLVVAGVTVEAAEDGIRKLLYTVLGEIHESQARGA